MAAADETAKSSQGHGAAGRGAVGREGESSLYGAARAANSKRKDNDGDADSKSTNSHLALLVSLLLALAALVPVVIWTVIKAARQSDGTTGGTEVLFQSLNTEQILGKIIKK
jgi:hypothetical protein